MNCQLRFMKEKKFNNFYVMISTYETQGSQTTCDTRYSRTFYLQIRLLTLAKMVQNDNFPVKNGLFICEFKIRSSV